jgi:hypothetical protein
MNQMKCFKQFTFLDQTPFSLIDLLVTRQAEGGQFGGTNSATSGTSGPFLESK